MFNVNVLIHSSTATNDKTFYCHFEALDFFFIYYSILNVLCVWLENNFLYICPHLLLTYSYNIYFYIFIPDILLQKLSKQALLLPETTQKSILACRMGTRLTSFFYHTFHCENYSTVKVRKTVNFLKIKLNLVNHKITVLYFKVLCCVLFFIIFMP